MKYCSECGEPVSLIVPEGDNRERYVCTACTTVHYQNPRIVTGCLVTSGDQVLLCKRAIQPRNGRWTLPAGFLENGETSHEGAVRETWEEACAKVEVKGLYTVFNLPHISQVYMFFRAELRGEYRPGFESEAVELFAQSDVPWDELAFPVIRDTLNHYFEDRQNNQFPVHMGDVLYARDPRR
jgi:ADP-ribose pyrophosphatase YjhB (NUDIX family)